MNTLASLRCMVATLLLSFFYVTGCSPAGSGDAAPPHLELDRTALTFGPAEDVKPLIVKNTGGSSFGFAAQVSASSGGVEWLQATPESGAVSGDSTATVLVHVVGRDKLAAGTYSGEITVTAEGVGSEVVLVSMEVGQPILDVDPISLDYGASLATMNLVVKNTGAGQLVFALHLPGAWMTTPGVLQKSIGPGEPEIFELQVLRDQVPWYGHDEAELLVTSNGLNDADHSSTLKVPVLVDVDASCAGDSECAKEGYFCDLSTLSGICTRRLKLGQPCEASQECLSGSCVDDVCCDSPCQGACLTCDGSAGKGVCGSALDGLACESEDLCTYGGTCDNGSCVTKAYSCDDDLDCTADACLGGQACKNTPLEGFCVIDGMCMEAGSNKPDSGGCASCSPGSDSLGWTASPDGEKCDDSDPCTLEDQCDSGACLGVANECDDDLECTTNTCQPDSGDCTWELTEDWCLIDDVCYSGGAGDLPSSPDKDCRICDPATSTATWTPIHEEQVCNDLSDCTAQSMCKAGACLSDDLPCDDGNVCTQDICLPNQTCDHPPVAVLTFCSDGLLCTQDDLCDSGICVGTPVDCGPTLCKPAWCDEGTGQCKDEDAPEGTPCDDESPCTVTDGCSAGECLGVEKDCSELAGDNPCQLAYCDPEGAGGAGACAVKLQEVGTPCLDGLFCTDGDACDAAGECIGGAPTSCDELSDNCNDGSCDENADECIAVHKQDGTLCNADNDGCTSNDSCDKGECLPGNPVICPQQVPQCYEAVCESVSPGEYECFQSSLQAGTPCDDDKFCTMDETCDGNGSCANGTPRDCQSELAECQLGSCNDITKSCKVTAAEDGASCNDGNDCTLVDSCTNGFCSPGSDVCKERRLNSTAANLPYGGPADTAHLGYGTAVTVVSWYPAVATAVTEELSKVVPAQVLETGVPCAWPPGAWASKSLCSSYGGPEMHGRAVAARPDGHWLVTEMNRCGVATVLGQFAYFISDMGHEDGAFAVFDGKLQETSAWSELAMATLWQLGGECKTGDWKGCLYTWCGKWVNHLGLKLPDRGGMGALAFNDGSFGLLSDSGVATYRAVSSAFVSGALKPLEGQHAPQGCVLPSNNAVLVYDDGAGKAFGVFSDKNGNLLGEPFELSETLAGNQERPFCESLSDGRFVVLFNTGFAGGPADVYAQVFKPNGSPQTSTVKVHSATNGNQQAVSKPAVLNSDTIVVTWEDETGDAAGYGVRARLFDAALAPLTAELQVNNSEGGDQRWPVAQQTGSGWMVVWADALGGTLYDFKFRKYDANGNPQKGAPEQFATHGTAGDQRQGDVAALPDGNFAVVWAGEGIDGPDSGIGLRLFEPGGLPTSGDIQVNDYAAGSQYEPSIAYDLSSDRLLVAWTSSGQEEMDDVYARVVDAAGQPVSGEFLVNTTTGDVQYEPAVATCGDGVFAVAWTSYTSIADGNDVFLRLFDDNGAAVSEELQINTDPADEQGQPAALAYCDDAGTGLLAGWTRTSFGGDVGVYARLFDSAGVPTSESVLISDEENPEQLALARAGNGTVMACWRTDVSIRCQRLDAQLQPVGSVFTAEAAGTPAHPRLVFRSPERFWLSYDKSDADAGGQAVVRADLDLTGAEKGSRILVNWHETADQSDPFMGMLAADDIIIGWTGEGQDGDGDGVFFRVLD